MHMKYFVILFFCFLFCPSVETKSQSIESVIRFGDSLFQHTQYRKALHEYQRAFFFAGDELKPLLSENIAGCYFALEDFQMARNYYDSAIYYSTSDHLSVDSEFQKIRCFMMEDNFGYALLQLNDLEVGADIHLQRKRNLYQGICCFVMGQYDEMQQHFLKSIPKTDTLKINQLQLLYEERKMLKRPDPRLAMVLSIILPGAGQVYSGDIKEGLNSLFLLSGLVYLGTSGLFINPFLTIPFFQRYYIGGIIRTKEIAQEKRKNNQYEYYLKFKRVISETSSFRTLFEPETETKEYPTNLKNSESELKILLYVIYLGYKEFISSQDVDACVFYPSCSDYTIEAIEKKGVVIGLLEGFDRLSRCHPFIRKYDYSYDTLTTKYHDPL